MTIAEYIEARLKIMHVEVRDVHGFMLAMGVNSEDELEDKDRVDKLFIRLIYGTMVRPDIAEDSYSIKWDRKYVMSWLKSEATRLGIEDEFDFADTIKDISHLA